MRRQLRQNTRFACLRDNPGRRRVVRLCMGILSFPHFPRGCRFAGSTDVFRQVRSHAQQIAWMRHGRAGGETIFPCQGSLPQLGYPFPPWCPTSQYQSFRGRVQTVTDLGIRRRRSSTRPTSPTKGPTSRTPSSCARCAPSRTCLSRGASRRATPCPCTCP